MADRTLSVTMGRWGGFYARRQTAVPGWRLCLGFVAFTWSKGEIPAHEALLLGMKVALENPEQARQRLKNVRHEQEGA